METTQKELLSRREAAYLFGVTKKTDILKFRNLGRKTINEIDDKLDSLGLSFGMDVSRYNNAYFNKIQRKYDEERKGGNQ